MEDKVSLIYIRFISHQIKDHSVKLIDDLDKILV